MKDVLAYSQKAVVHPDVLRRRAADEPGSGAQRRDRELLRRAGQPRGVVGRREQRRSNRVDRAEQHSRRRRDAPPAPSTLDAGSVRWRPSRVALPSLALFVCVRARADRWSRRYYSLHEWNGFGALDHVVGLRNYRRRAVRRRCSRRRVGHNLIIVALSLVIQLPLSIGLALLLNRRMRGRAFLRLVVFAPYVLSEAITAVIWLLLLQPDGFVDELLQDDRARRARPAVARRRRRSCSTRCSW